MHKEVVELEQTDLAEYPIWFFTADGPEGDEMTVVPETASRTRPAHAPLIVRCTFATNNGRFLSGYVYHYSLDDSGPDSRKPVLWTDGEVIEVWHGILDPVAAGTARKIFALLPDFSWPIRYVSDVPVEDSLLTGEVAGVYWIDSAGVTNCGRAGDVMPFTE